MQQKFKAFYMDDAEFTKQIRELSEQGWFIHAMMPDPVHQVLAWFVFRKKS